MNIWTKKKLGSICDEFGGKIQTGPFGSQLHQSDYTVEGTPVVMPKDLVDGTISTDDIARVSERVAKKLSRYKLHQGDIVYGRRGDIGRQAIILSSQDGWLCGTGCISIRVDKKVLEPRFIHYYLNQDSLIGWMKGQAIGSTMPNLNTEILRSTSIIYPDIDSQKNISSILGAYDDLIENNEKRIKALEEMTRLLYTEWFVRFKFPGHEKVKMINSVAGYGKIPEGWEMKSLADSNIFLAYKERVRKFEGEKLYFDTSCIDGIRIIKEPLVVNWDTVPSRAQFSPINNSVWFARMSNTYKVLVFDKSSEFEVNNYLLSSGMLGLETEAKYLGFLFALVKSELFHRQKDSRATGATQVSLTDEGFLGIMILFPTIGLIEKYSNIANGYIGQILALQRQSNILSKTRDLLIPQLVTGKRELK